jgi:hypothetical protein
MTYETIKVAYCEALRGLLKAQGIAKWDGKHKWYVAPAGFWAAMLNQSDLGADLYRHGAEWSEVLGIIEIMHGAQVGTSDAMPVYKFSGGRVRQIA